MKIGKSVDPARRVAQLQGGHPYKLRVLLLWEHHDTHAVESAVHRRLAGSRMAGEWFAIALGEARSAVEEILKGFGDHLPAEEPTPIEVKKPSSKLPNDATQITDFDRRRLEIAKLQEYRRGRLDAIEEALGFRLTRRQIIAFELKGECGQTYAELRHQQGWRLLPGGDEASRTGPDVTLPQIGPSDAR